MKKFRGKSIISFALALLMMVCYMPLPAFAATAGRFILVAEADGELIFAPEYVEYAENFTVGEALLDSKYDFYIGDDGVIYEINGISGNYKRSDEDDEYDLTKSASEVSHYRFTEEEKHTITEGLQKLMTAMADYLLEEDDVKAAAKEKYDIACNMFVGIDSDSAAWLAEELNKAVADYKSVLNGPQYTVTVKNNGNIYSGSEFTLENAHGKIWNETESDGKLQVPAGEYIFTVSKDSNTVSGSINVAANTEVVFSVSETDWIDTSELRLSGSYNALNEEDGLFTDDEFAVGNWTGRNVTVPVTDRFTGTVYSYIKETESAGDDIKIIAEYQKAGKKASADISLNSFVSGAPETLKRGASGNTVVYNAVCTGEDGYTYTQQYTVKLDRVPTLTSISVSDQEGTDQAATELFDAEKKAYTYKVLDTVEYITINANPLSDDYTVMVNDKAVSNKNGIKIELKKETTDVEVKVSYGEYENVYILTVLKGAGQQIIFKTDTDTSLKVTNKNNMVMPCKYEFPSNGEKWYIFTLVAEDTYNYIATKNEYFHAADIFELEDLYDATITVNVPTESWLKELAFGEGASSKNKGNIKTETDFTAENHKYTIVRPDRKDLIYVWCNTDESDVTIKALYKQIFSADLYHGKDYVIDILAENTQGVQIKRFLLNSAINGGGHPQGNTLTIRVSKDQSVTDDGVTYYQDYIIDVSRKLSLNNISARCDGKTAVLVQKNGNKGYQTDITEYDITVPMAAQKLELSIEKSNATTYGEEENTYRIIADGKNVTASGSAVFELDGTINTQKLIVKVESDQAPNGTTEYIFNILKSPPVETTFNTSPQNAVFTVYENLSGDRQWPNSNGSYQLCEGFSYDYTVTKYGYVGRKGTLNVTRDSNNALVVTDSFTGINHTVTENGDGGAAIITLGIEKAPENTDINSKITAYWPDFRGDNTNNAIKDVKIPYKAEEGTLYWASKIGDGIDSGAVGSPIIVDDDIVTYAGHTIFRINTVTGDIIATGKMAGASSFAITPPVYAEGMIFVALSNGTVQAFNAENLESLWIYEDVLGGQPNCPITVKDGYLYTGFWVGERENANYVCLSLTDENPSESDESKIATWTYTSKGGYYWAGAYANSDYVIVGTDDGESGYTEQLSKLLMLDAKTGRLIDSWDKLMGDIRSTVVYDESTDAYYFTSKGGYFYSVKVKKSGDSFEFTDKWSIKLDNGTDGIPMSTCSPAVYNGRAYVGVSGAGQFSAYSGHNITVIDIESKKIAYSVPTQGYPQTSGLLTTAYEEANGNVYVYFFDNMTPGKLRVISDKKGQTKANYTIEEYNSYTTAYALFTPVGQQAEYAICSPITDKYGTIYFKNDSAYLMAFGSAIDKIEITTSETFKTTYTAGEIFDPEGMQVTAVYANGTTRDITDYVSYNTKQLTKADETFTISFEYVMYHNAEKGNSLQAGVSTSVPTATIQIKVITETLGDVNNDGSIDETDVQAVLDYEAQKNIELNSKTADVSGDKVIDSNDAVLIAQFIADDITEFPAQQNSAE